MMKKRVRPFAGRRSSIESEDKPDLMTPPNPINEYSNHTELPPKRKQSPKALSDALSNASSSNYARIEQQIKKVMPTTDNEDPDYMSVGDQSLQYNTSVKHHNTDHKREN